MCGIVGIFDPAGGPVAADDVAAMAARIVHRGPDDEGVFTADGIGIGSRRLSILDPTPRGHMPMLDTETGNVIVHNGEIYNYKEIADELGLRDLKTGTDTEVILRAYGREGIDCVKRFNGIFAFAIWDAKARRLFCARDRLGVKPLFLARHQGRLLIASEVKALLAAGLAAAPALSVIHDYLVGGVYEHRRDTFFEGVEQLPGGAYLLADAEGVSEAPYWRLGDVPEAGAEAPWDAARFDTACADFRDLAVDAIRLQLRSDVPVAAHVSGGLDSAFLMAALNKINGGQENVRAFSYVYGEAEYDERPFVEDVAAELGWDVDFHKLSSDQVPDLAAAAMWHQEQPYPGIITLAKHNLIEQTVPAGAKVVLEGQGGDEIGAGYQYHMGPHVLDLIQSGNAAQALAEVEGFARLNGLSVEQSHAKILNSQAAAFRTGWSADGSSFLNHSCLNPDFIAADDNAVAFERPFRSNLLNMQYRDVLFSKLPRILRSCDRASMAFGRELRVPILDHRLVEFTFALPGNFKILDGAQRTFMRSALGAMLPRSLADIPKRAVVDPQRKWLQRDLRDWVEGFLYSDSFAARGLFDPVAARREFERYVQDEAPNNSFHIWQWISIEQWFRTFVDTPQGPAE